MAGDSISGQLMYTLVPLKHDISRERILARII